MESRKVYLTSGNLLQAHTWKGLLETSGISVELKGEALLGGIGELPVDLQAVQLWVHDHQCEMAQSILESINVERPEWQCVQCHEVNEGCFDLCWQCSAPKSTVRN